MSDAQRWRCIAVVALLALAGCGDGDGDTDAARVGGGIAEDGVRGLRRVASRACGQASASPGPTSLPPRSARACGRTCSRPPTRSCRTSCTKRGWWSGRSRSRPTGWWSPCPPTAAAWRASTTSREPGVRIAVGAPTVPGRAPTRARSSRAWAPEAARRIERNIRSNEPDVAGVIGKVAQGAVDAGFVYVTDVRAAGGRLRAIEIPARLRPQVVYGAAVVEGHRPRRGRARVRGGPARGRRTHAPSHGPGSSRHRHRERRRAPGLDRCCSSGPPRSRSAS